MTPPEATDLFPTEWHADVVIDARGALCPEPILRLARAARDLGSGTIALAADDPAAESDVAAWCAMRAATLVDRILGPQHGAYLVRVTPPQHPATGG